MAMNTSLEKEVLNHLLTGSSITSMEAISLYGATRLSAIIFNLRDKGYSISTTMISSKNRYGNTVSYAEYKII